MMNEVFERPEVVNLLKEIFNNPKYYNKNTNEDLKNNDYLQERALFLFYDALYKYKLIIDDDKLLKDFIIGIETLYRKIENFEDIKYGTSKLLGKLILKKLNIDYEDLDNKLNYVLETVYDKYVVNGYYIKRLNKKDYELVKESRKFTDKKYLDWEEELSKILKKYNYDLYDDTFNYEFDTDFSRACLRLISYPSYLYNLVDNDSPLYLKNKKNALKSINELLYKLNVLENDKKKIIELFNNILDYYKDESNSIYLAFIRRDKIKSMEPYAKNDNLSYEESLYNIFSTYDDYEVIDVDNILIDDFSILPNYNTFISDKKNTKMLEIYENEYGSISIILIVGIILILLGVLLSIILI